MVGNEPDDNDVNKARNQSPGDDNLSTSIDTSKHAVIGARIDELFVRFPELVRPADTGEKPAMSTATVVDQETVRLQSDICRLEVERIEQAVKIHELQRDVEAQLVEHRNLRDAIARYASTTEELERKQRLQPLLARVCAPAQEALLLSDLADRFQEHLFNETNPCCAFVVSIDIRRSTELMLKTKSARQFALFLTTLGDKLRRIVIDEYGVFDKFTGDGILAFFPEFYSGKDAALRVIRAAQACHREFQRHYRQSWGSFTAIMKDTGLGIGVDFGAVQGIQIGGEITVVGGPVVYACRLGAAQAGKTVLNHPAYEKISQYVRACICHETEIDFKHEGPFVAFEVVHFDDQHSPATPEWMQVKGIP